MSPGRAVDLGCELACLVRDEGPDAIAAWVDRHRQDLGAVVVALAAMLPVDSASPAELLAWIDDPDTSGPPPVPVQGWVPVPTVPAGTARAGQPVDEVAVRRACEGDRSVVLSPAERVAAIRRLHAEGLADGQVAERLGLTARTVLRIRTRVGLPTRRPRPDLQRARAGAA